MAILTKKLARQRRHRRIRGALSGTAERPRLTIFVTAKHIRVQLIDDDTARTLISASSDEKVNVAAGMKANIAGGTAIGALVAERARNQGIECVVFDRCGFKYHGVVKAVAEAAREGGLKF